LRATSTGNPRRAHALRRAEGPIGIEQAPVYVGGGTLTEAGPSNVDMLAWFSEDERNVCGSCGQRASVSFPDALASFCLACGAISVDGVPIDSNFHIAS